MQHNTIHLCTSDDMHPYNCDTAFGGTCIHCEKSHEGTEKCALCHPELYQDSDDRLVAEIEKY